LKKNRILITGGTGFIGYHLAKKCIKLSWSVDSVSTKSPPKKRKLKKVQYLKFDISKKENLMKNLSSNYDYIVNLAGYVDHTNKNKTMKSHFDGCKNLAMFFLKKKIKKFVQIGSSIEYGRLKSPQIENLDRFKKTYSYYGNAKQLSTKYLLNLFRKKKFPVTILRLYLVYGPYQSTNRVIPITITNAIKGIDFDCSEGKQLRDFLHIEDVVRAIIKSLKNKKTSGEIINIGMGKPTKVKDLILKICRLVGSGKPKFGKIDLRKDEMISLYPSISKAKKLIKWKPRIELNLGLKKTIKYFKKNE
jgi:nucleoside-diphosphate-sugar epimerase